MSYSLRFRVEAKKEWDALGATVRAQFKKKLAERLENPHVPSARLHGSANRFKIKLRAVGYQLDYEVRDTEHVVSVVSVGKRERHAVYRDAAHFFLQPEFLPVTLLGIPNQLKLRFGERASYFRRRPLFTQACDPVAGADSYSQ